MTRRRARIGRPLAAALLIGSLFAGLSVPSTSLAAPTNEPSKSGLDAARAQLTDLNNKVEILAEQYNNAQVAVDQAQNSLNQAQGKVDQYGAAEKAATDELAKHTTAAYEGGVTSELDVLLSASSFNEFSQRLEYLNRVSAQDSDLAAKATVAGQQATWAAQDYAAAKKKAQDAAAQLAQKKAAVEKAVQQQQALVSKLEAQYKAQLEAARKAAAAAAAADAAGGTGGSGGVPSGGGDSGFNPPPQSSGAATAVAAAQSRIGSKYVWGASGPTTFDCSGLTMWSWGQAGVSLVHSSSGQYASLPHVDKSQLQPGDLLFFYNPIHHVAIYVGGGQEVDASNPQTPVSQHGVDWGNYVGAARPG
jgi:cell wall-associated NlpC family hydrolase